MSRLSKRWERVRSNDVGMGLLALAVAAAVLVGVTYFYLSPPGRQMITFTTRDAASLSPGMDVRVAGISVGTVADVRLLPENVAVDLDVDGEVGVGDRSSVKVQLLTAVGGYFVSLVPGGRVTEDSSTIAAQRVSVPYTIADTLQELPRITDEVSGNTIEQSLAQLSKGLGDNTASVRALIGGLHSLASVVDDQRRQVDKVAALAAEYTTTFDNSRAFVFELIRKVNVALSQFYTYRAGFSEAYRQLGGVLERLGAVSTFYLNHSDQIYPAVVAARDTALRMRDGMDAMITNLGPLQQNLTSLVSTAASPGAQPFVIDATRMCLPVPGRSC
ncbi:MlaD family protein [Gordonia sp. NPDC003376]